MLLFSYIHRIFFSSVHLLLFSQLLFLSIYLPSSHRSSPLHSTPLLSTPLLIYLLLFSSIYSSSHFSGTPIFSSIYSFSHLYTLLLIDLCSSSHSSTFLSVCVTIFFLISLVYIPRDQVLASQRRQTLNEQVRKDADTKKEIERNKGKVQSRRDLIDDKEDKRRLKEVWFCSPLRCITLLCYILLFHSPLYLTLLQFFMIFTNTIFGFALFLLIEHNPFFNVPYTHSLYTFFSLLLLGGGRGC